MQLSEAGFARLAALRTTSPRPPAGGRVVLVLEGGYDLRGLSRSVEATLRTVAGLGTPQASHKPPEVPYAVVRERVRKARRALSQYWAL
jgi:acetoin utilization deacetylase AcuC-like enzyme